MKIAVLGSGMVGITMAIDLSTNHEVVSFDASQHALSILNTKAPAIKTVQADLSDYAHYYSMLEEV